ncbi:ABC transporter permease [candidate division KSB1 bacterium]|nr:ABC transporter permease [candidate division KSB1 bacterium]NIR68641.1 ABC transporter permease [candidate division KSB1 bacterium]NIS27130.1 ABC transporter permease [candidate division KSB1 bacterium]NIT74016.1 ABC transporter permease [candidate division KSB1 bacterium]NIU27882.1 ABC transporter permease [candidate division KSB1 bacterium]
MLKTRVIPIIRKEFVHISRDFRTLVIIIVMPIAMLFLYGFAINMEIQNVNLVVLDHDKTPDSRALIRKFEGSKFFTVAHFTGPESRLESFFDLRDARMILILPEDFSERLYRDPRVNVQVLIDASDPNAAQAIRNYSDAIFHTFSAENGTEPLFEIESSFWYNPSLDSADFFVPGLVALILIMISALLTSIAIVREKETGTMEQILVSPIRPLEIIVGKVVPYIILAFVDLLIILIIAKLVFQVPFVGSLSLLLFSSLLFIFTALSLGLLISTRAKTQQVAMMMALLATLLPTVLLSGFIFPINSLPKILQFATYLVPARYFLVVIRGIMLKGNTLIHVWPELAILAGISVALVAISAKKFKVTLEI